MAEATRKSVIVTFKPKDQRPDQTRDKVDILRTAITSQEHLAFVDAVTLPQGSALPAGLPHTMIGYDVNRYEAPIVTASLTDAEINTLRRYGYGRVDAEQAATELIVPPAIPGFP